MRPLKLLALVLAAAVGLLIVGAILLILFFDPNDYRDQIEQAVERETGRELELAGELSLSIFPWLAITTGPADLGDAPGFGPEPFLAVEGARLGVRLLPLLRGEVEVGQVTLEAPRIRLITAADGRNNWDDLGETGAGGTAADEPSGAPAITIAGLRIRDGALLVEDRAADSRLVVREIDLETGRLAAGEPFDLEAAFAVEQGDMTADVAIQGEVTYRLEPLAVAVSGPRIEAALRGEAFGERGLPIELSARELSSADDQYRLTDVEVEATVYGESLPADGVPVIARLASLEANLERQTAAVTGLDLDAAGATLSADKLEGSQILDAPVVAGQVQLEPLAPREWLPRIGIEVPEMRDPAALSSFSGDARLTASADSARLEALTIQLDQTTATGRFEVVEFEPQALRFDLAVDRIDFDRYMAPDSEAADAAGEATPTEIPVDLLRSLDVAGELRIGSARLAGVDLTDVRLAVTARDGRVSLSPSEAGLFGGRFAGEAAIDASGPVPTLTLNERLNGIDFAQLFATLLESDRVSGQGSATARVTASGNTTDALLRSLSGTLAFDVADGALEGLDLWYEIRRARALLERESVPAREGPARTPFHALEGSGEIRNGVLATEDLQAALDYLRVDGRGTLDLIEREADYALRVQVLDVPPTGADAAAMQELVRAEIPVSVSGPLSDLAVRPDVESYLKGRAQQALEEEADELEQKLEEKLEEKLGDKLRDILGGDR